MRGRLWFPSLLQGVRGRGPSARREQKKVHIMGEKLRVGVIFGGRSGEHEVSIASAASVLKALDSDKYEVVPIGITAEGHWLAGVDPQPLLQGATMEDAVHNGQATAVTMTGDPTSNGLVPVESRRR